MADIRLRRDLGKLRTSSRSDYDIDRVLAESRYRKDMEKLKKLIDNLKSRGVVVEV